MSFTFADPTEWWLELPTAICDRLWQHSQPHATPDSRWTAYLNQLALETILEWIQTTYAPHASRPPTAELTSRWELVTGSLITVGNLRLAIIPSDATASDRLEVPQEWVDIPSWAADYYLATQVEVDEHSLRVWGYATHQELKTQGRHDASDRTYTLTADALTRDLSSLWATIEFCPTAQTQAELAPLPALDPLQATNLIQRLSASPVTFPRLAVPFTTWGALLENPDWRQQLYQTRRTGIAPVSLSNWLRGSVETLWQSLESVLSSPQIESAWRSRRDARLMNSPAFAVSRVKVLDFDLQSGEQQVALLLGIAAQTNDEIAVGVQVCPVGDATRLPNPVQVRLLDDAGNEIAQASATVTETIQLQFSGSPGDRFSVEVVCGDRSLTEPFEI
jgi:Protein of unknown function (DUF1822)